MRGLSIIYRHTSIRKSLKQMRYFMASRRRNKFRSNILEREQNNMDNSTVTIYCENTQNFTINNKNVLPKCNLDHI